MSLTKALIREAEYLKTRGLYDLFVNTKKQNEIPIYYQYNQTTITKPSLPEKDLIGFASNIREEDGMVICDVILSPVKNKSKNFMGIIDNYTLKTIKNNQRLDADNYEIVRFLVYDKDFKRKVDEKLHEQSKRNK